MKETLFFFVLRYLFQRQRLTYIKRKSYHVMKFIIVIARFEGWYLLLQLSHSFLQSGTEITAGHGDTVERGGAWQSPRNIWAVLEHFFHVCKGERPEEAVPIPSYPPQVGVLLTEVLSKVTQVKYFQVPQTNKHVRLYQRSHALIYIGSILSFGFLLSWAVCHCTSTDYLKRPRV